MARAAVAAAPKRRKVSFGAEMSPAKVVVGWHGSGADCSEAEEEKSIYSEEESEWVGGEGPQPLRRCLFGGETLQLDYQKSICLSIYLSLTVVRGLGRAFLYLSIYLRMCAARRAQ